VQCLKSKAFLPVLFPRVDTMLKSPDWRVRYAAVHSLCRIAEAFPQGEADKYNMIADVFVACARDAHPKVRWCVLTGVGWYCHYQCPNFQNATHTKIMPLLTEACADSSRRVRVWGLAASLVFFGCCAINVSVYTGGNCTCPRQLW
jgi:hypothetical protein